MLRLRIDRRLIAYAQLDRIDSACDRELVDGALECEHPGALAGPRKIVGEGRSSRAKRWVVRRFGAAYIMRVATAVCSANSSMVEVCSTTSCAIAVSVPSRPATELHALDRRRAISDQREHLARVSWYFNWAAGELGRHYGEDNVRGVNAFEPKPPRRTAR